MDLGPVDRVRAEACDRPVFVLEPDRNEHISALQDAPELALDLESDNFHSYQERVCLIQLSTADADWFLDPLEHGLPEPIASQLVRTDRTINVHAAENDVRALKRDFGLTLGRLFDTSLAARILGLPNFGLKDLLEAELGVVLDKQAQRSDWSRRPLDFEQLQYARYDVRWLTSLAERLATYLDDVGRRAWHDEECERVRSVEPTQKRFEPESWRKVKTAKSLGPRGRAVMAAVWRWREGEACRTNVPAIRVLHADQVARVAKVADAHGPKILEKVEGFRFLPSALNLDGLRTAIETGLAEPDPGARKPQASKHETPRPALDEAGKARLGRLREGRGQWAAHLGIEPGFLLTNQLLDRIARRGPTNQADLSLVSGLEGWRLEVLGKEILNVLRL